MPPLECTPAVMESPTHPTLMAAAPPFCSHTKSIAASSMESDRSGCARTQSGYPGTPSAGLIGMLASSCASVTTARAARAARAARTAAVDQRFVIVYCYSGKEEWKREGG